MPLDAGIVLLCMLCMQICASGRRHWVIVHAVHAVLCLWTTALCLWTTALLDDGIGQYKAVARGDHCKQAAGSNLVACDLVATLLPTSCMVLFNVWPEAFVFTVNLRHFWQGNHQIYGHIWCIFTVLVNPVCITIGGELRAQTYQLSMAAGSAKKLHQIHTVHNCL